MQNEVLFHNQNKTLTSFKLKRLYSYLKIILTILIMTEKSFSASKHCETVNITAHPDYPPFHWREKDKIVGASIEVTGKILKRLGINYNSNYIGPWNRVLHAAKNGDIDLIVSLKKTHERELFLDFTKYPIFKNSFSIFTLKKKQFEFSSWHDLIGKIGTKNSGDQFGNDFDQFVLKNLTIIEANSPEMNLKKLLHGRADYFIHSKYSGLLLLSTSEGYKDITMLDNNINHGYTYSGFSKKSGCKKLLPEISKHYQDMLSSGEADNILKKHMNRWLEWYYNKN